MPNPRSPLISLRCTQDGASDPFACVYPERTPSEGEMEAEGLSAGALRRMRMLR